MIAAGLQGWLILNIALGVLLAWAVIAIVTLIVNARKGTP